MKGFLFDENLPRRIRFTPFLPIIHVEAISVSPQDGAVWDYARTEFLAIVSKDINPPFKQATSANRSSLFGSLEMLPV